MLNLRQGCIEHPCIEVCPKDAIHFEEEYDGFKYPVIDQNKCIDCGLCEKTCPVLNTSQ